ncbi:Rho-type gtpase-activating protein [Arachnomyces sp. PD_36]|nr:Rho-type gtpase-activating protein [Arachnomyces sp. PD_36]
MADVMDTQAGYPESPLDQDEIPFPCKGCGEMLEEGKAFELDSDANLLLLGDGSLICNDCTYSCSSCGNKIEDLAILTGDQAFCGPCFKCRNCKRKIENLRYARTSQGIFCMDCHESLMARRRKRSARNAAQRQKIPSSSMHLDKSLPSLPPTAMPRDVASPDVDTPMSDPYSDVPSEPAPRSRPANHRMPSRNEASDSSPIPAGTPDNVLLPSSTYQSTPSSNYPSNRQSAVSNKSESNGPEFLIPVVYDPNDEHQSPSVNPNVVDDRSRDYFSQHRSGHSSKKDSTVYQNNVDDSQEASDHASPHIAYQEKGRPSISEDQKGSRQVSGSDNSTTAVSPSTSEDRIHQQTANTQSRQSEIEKDKFQLQDVPKKSTSGRDSKTESISTPRENTPSPETLSSGDAQSMASPPPRDASKVAPAIPQRGVDQDISSPRPSQEARARATDSTRSIPSPKISEMQYPPKRGDSLDNKFQHSIQRKEVGSTRSPTTAAHDVPEAAIPDTNSPSTANGGKRSSKSKDISGAFTPQPPRTDSAMGASKSTFASPRAAPVPPENRNRHNRHESISTLQSEPPRASDLGVTPGMLRYSTVGDLTMEEDMARILGNDDPQSQESFLRRVSNSVRHGRSFSDKGSRMSKEHKWPKSPTNGPSSYGHNVNSPTATSPEHNDEVAWYKNELKRERARAIERDQKISELETALSASTTIKQVNTELREKRSTMVVLDAQKEIVLKELEVLTEHIASEKKSNAPLDLAKMSNSVLREFAEAVQRLKESFAPQIEDLIQQRNDLVEELATLTRQKDKSFQEFETLSLKNAQLADLNNQLVSQIQGLYQANTTADSNGRTAPNGLGIYSHQKDKSTTSVEGRDLRTPAHDGSLATPSTLIQQEEAEPATVVPGPQVVSIRKGGQARKFNWKKGGQNVAKGVTKGLKGAFSSGEQKQQREGQLTEGQPYSSMSTPHDSGSNVGVATRSHAQDPRGFGFFGNQKNKAAAAAQMKPQASNGSSPALPDNPAALFGTDLEQRLQYEKCVIPGIVTRCIEEVELRGMDMEGIYRKSGGSSQVQQIREGFEANPSDYDISDPDLDIHAVTSALKQYLRKLPMPLITFDVYDKLLECNGITPVSARITTMQCGLQGLPRVHRDLLEFLVFHLKRVVEREKENLMTSMNVAVVFAPTIMRPESLAREMTDVQKKNEAMQFLVDHCQEIFMGMMEE